MYANIVRDSSAKFSLPKSGHQKPHTAKKSSIEFKNFNASNNWELSVSSEKDQCNSMSIGSTLFSSEQSGARNK